jgi:DNA repair protein RadC
MATVPVVDRPREKLARAGAVALGDSELVALVLGAGTRQRGALVVAQDVIETAGGVTGLVRLGLDDLTGIAGVGASRAAKLLAAVELGRRSLCGDDEDRPRLVSTEAIASYLMPRYGGFAVERFGVVLFDYRQRVIRSQILSTGTAEASLSHPRDVFRTAVVAGAARVVLFHNHPSGDPLPSQADRVMTERLKLAGEIMGVEVMDHIILGNRAYFSFRTDGRATTSGSR